MSDDDIRTWYVQHSDYVSSIAAKDAEIAELARQLEMSRSSSSTLQSVHQEDSRRICEQAAEIKELREKLIGWDELCSTSIGGYDAGIPPLVAAATEITSLIHALAGSDADYKTVVTERDEARECVRRLYAALQPFANTVPIEPTGLITGLMREDFSTAVSALAATPEHLR